MPFYTWVEAQCDVCERLMTDRVEGREAAVPGNLIGEDIWRQVTDVPWLGHDWFLCSAACAERWVNVYGRPGLEVTMHLYDGSYQFKAAVSREAVRGRR